jgi:uncharacterized protein YmfQ (DUF2313 family)
MAYLAQDFLNATLALLLRGRMWNKSALSNMWSTLALFTPALERFNARGDFLLVDAFPATTDELLPEWEATLGLPDKCAGEAPTLALRRAQVVARLTNSGGQSIAYYTEVLSLLGYAVTISEGTTFRAGFSRVGDHVGGAYANTWTVSAPLYSINYFRTGSGTAGEPLASWSNEVLECVIRELEPSHTYVTFVYS